MRFSHLRQLKTTNAFTVFGGVASAAIAIQRGPPGAEDCYRQAVEDTLGMAIPNLDFQVGYA